MTTQDILHKRVLVTVKESYSNSKIEEYKILEISPSGKWVKCQNMHGSKFWKMYSDIQIVEILANLEAKPL